MNVLLLNRDLQVGGGVTYIRSLVDVLRAHGDHVTIVAGPGPEASSLAGDQVRVIPVPLVSTLQRSWLASLLKRCNIDIVNIHSRTPARIAASVCQKLDLPFVITAHGPVYGRRLELLRPIYQNAAALIVMNEGNAGYYRKQGIAEDRLVLSRLMLPWPEASQRGRRTARRFMYCSRLSGLKGPRAESWLRAMAVVSARRDYEIAIAGSGSYESRLREVARELGLAVAFVGSRPDISRHFAEIDLLAGAGFTALEGLRVGCGVVGIGFEGCSGAVTPESLPESLAVNFGDNAYEQLDSSPERVAKALELAIEVVASGDADTVSKLARSQCSSDVVGRQVLALFEHVIAGKSAAELSLANTRREFVSA